MCNLNEKICSFFGHREIVIDSKLKQQIKETIILLILKENVCIFYFGGFGDFDECCWEIVTELKKTYSHIKRVYCLEKEDWQYRKNKRPKRLADDRYEDFIYLPLTFDYWYTAIYYRNCAMIEYSDFVVFYAEEKENSGAYKAYKYAVKKKKKIINFCNK